MPDVQDLQDQHEHARDVPGRRPGDRRAAWRDDVRSIDLAPTAAFLLGIPVPQQSQGVVRRDMLERRASATRPLSIVGLNDFHGQLEPTHDADRRARPCPSAGRRSWRRCSTRRPTRCPGRTLLLAAGDNVGASPPNSALLEDTPAIDVENAWGLDATSFGNHEFDFGVARILAHQARADFPFLSANIVDEATGEDAGLDASRRRCSASTACGSA